jgi:ribosomal protein L40E
MNPDSTTSSTSSISLVTRYLYPALVAVVAGAVGVVATLSGGRESIAFLVAATLALGWILYLVFRAAQALVREPEAREAEVVTGWRRKELEREKRSLLKALKELDFDFEMGKVSKKDFEEIGSHYRVRAIRVMRQLDDAGGDYETMIARDVAARLRKSGDAGAVAGAAPGSSAATAAAASAMAPGTCPKCATRNDEDAEFCKKCGSKLRTEAAS